MSTARPATQVRALFSLRWQMIRSGGVKAAIIVTAVALLWIISLIAAGASRLQPVELVTAVRVAPQAFLGFAVLAVVAPLTAGGGNEVIPASQLVAFPVRPRSAFLGGLALAPVNLVWVIQILGLVAETTILTAESGRLAGALTALFYVAALTVSGQAFAWWIVGLRQRQSGRRTVAVAGALALLAVVVVIRAGRGTDALDRAPTQSVVRAIRNSDEGLMGVWGVVTGLLVLMTVLALVVGERACGWALSRPGDAGAIRSTRTHRRRPSSPSALRTLISVDRASVWRAPALRRGGLVLALLPGLAAAGAQVPWGSLVVLPGLVAAGAGLLFGVNAFCLDGSGALLLASMPHDPRLVLRSKAFVLTETVLAAALLAAVSGSIRSPGGPTGTEVLGILVSIVSCTAVVVSRGLATSVRRPHKADLNGPRDAVAPPGALTAASVKLALPAGLVGVTMGSMVRSGVWWLAPALAVPVCALAALSLARTFRLWDDPLVRSRIVQVVSSG